MIILWDNWWLLWRNLCHISFSYKEKKLILLKSIHKVTGVLIKLSPELLRTESVVIVVAAYQAKSQSRANLLKLIDGADSRSLSMVLKN